MARSILEREHELAELADAARAAAAGDGSVVLLYGEAGIGKSSLVDAIRGRLPAEGRMLVGHCDDLATARTLGPFRDLIGSVGPELTAALEPGADRDHLLTGLRAELDRAGRPTVLAIEDIHWADEATLDVLRYLVRRITQWPSVLLLTYRDDEVGRDHPLSQLLGTASRSVRTRQLPLRRLSPAAVGELSNQHGQDPAEVFAVTSGNPFFVSEVLGTTPGAGVPRTVVDAVLARLRSLDNASRAAVEHLSVVPSAIDRWLVDALVPGGVTSLTTGEERGLLTVTPARVTFRHELTRRAIVDALPTSRLIDHNERVLKALIEHDGADLSQLLHHAAHAGNEDAILRFGRSAGVAAAQGGSHREARAHFRLVLGYRASFPAAEEADLLELSAIECYTVGDDDRSAIEDQQAAVALRRTVDDPVALGASLRWLSRFLWWHGDRPGAEGAGHEAIEVLEGTGDRRLLAMAYSNLAQLDMLAERDAEAIAGAEQAITLARETGDAAVLSHALNNLGAASWRIGESSGQPALTESLQVALQAGESEHACRAYVNIVWRLLDERRLAEASTYLAEAMEFAERLEHIAFLDHMIVMRGRIELARAHWTEAISMIARGLDSPRVTRPLALILMTRAMIRSGQDARTLLAEVQHLANEVSETQLTGPAESVLCEAAWLRGDLDTIRQIAMPVYDEATGRRRRSVQGELAYWLRLAGEEVEPLFLDDPYSMQAVGRWQDAAKVWGDAGYPYEQASALAQSPRTADRIEALTVLDLIGAGPLARRVRAELRAAGVTGIPRGPSTETRRNQAGLTQRQLEVLGLLADGLTNAQIADQLVLSVRTASNHVSAILEKLGVHTREEAVARGRKFLSPAD